MMYISLLDKNIPVSHKNLLLAKEDTKYKKFIEEYVKKGFEYICLKGTRNNIISLDFITCSGRNCLLLENGSDFNIWKDIIEKYVYSKIKGFYGLFLKVVSEYYNDNGSKMYVISILSHKTPMTCYILKEQFDHYKFKENDRVPLRRADNNCIYIDYDRLKEYGFKKKVNESQKYPKEFQKTLNLD